MCRFREQDLAAMTGGGDARGAVDIQADIAWADELWGAGVQPEAHADLSLRGPGVRGESLGSLDRRGDGCRRSGEGDEEAVALGVDLNADVRRKRLAHQALML